MKKEYGRSEFRQASLARPFGTAAACAPVRAGSGRTGSTGPSGRRRSRRAVGLHVEASFGARTPGRFSERSSNPPRRASGRLFLAASPAFSATHARPNWTARCLCVMGVGTCTCIHCEHRRRPAYRRQGNREARTSAVAPDLLRRSPTLDARGSPGGESAFVRFPSAGARSSMSCGLASGAATGVAETLALFITP